MTLHLYAVAEAVAELPPMAGIGGGRLQRVSAKSLEAIVSDVAGATEPTEEAVLAHAAVVDALAETAEAVLPARFARGFDTEGAVVAALNEREPQLREALERVRGCVELGVRVLGADGPAPPVEPEPVSGRTYMLARLDRVRGAERLRAELDSELAPLARASTTNVVGAEPLVVTAAYLVERDDVDPFRARVEAFQDARPDVTLVCTGPWPPYSFATVDAEQP